jgi:hypothetical protein
VERFAVESRTSGVAAQTTVVGTNDTNIVTFALHTIKMVIYGL